MAQQQPDNTAVRTALWRALHVELDGVPPVLDDTLGLKLVAPEEGWRSRGDMHPQGTAPFRASIVCRARFVEDLVTQSTVRQYVMLGAGLDTFAQRRTDLASRVRVFEIDQPGTQEWKRSRLVETSLGAPSNLTFVPVDFELKESWWDKLTAAGFDPRTPAVISSLGVSMYLTREANEATLKQAATLAPGSSFVMTFMLPHALLDAEERAMRETVERGARSSGTPFITFFAPDELLAMARNAGFANVEHVAPAELTKRYLNGRITLPASENLLVARP